MDYYWTCPRCGGAVSKFREDCRACTAESEEALVSELPEIAYDSVRSQKLRDNIRYSSRGKEDSGLLAIAGALATFPVTEGAEDWKVHVVSPHVLHLTFSNGERYSVSVMQLPEG